MVRLSLRFCSRLGGVLVCTWLFVPWLAQPVHAGLIDELIQWYWTQTGELSSPSQWKSQPPSDTGPLQYNIYGQVQGVWGCHHWPQLHLSDFHHQQGADVTCGYIDIFPLLPPPNIDPAGARWLCILAPNAVVYTEPYNQGECFFTYSAPEQLFQAFEPTCAQVDAMTQAMNYLFAYYTYSETYSINTINRLRPSGCLAPLQEVSIGESDELTAEEVNLLLAEAEKLYTDRGFLHTDRELANEVIPAEIRAQLLHDAEAGNLEEACTTFAENVTLAEGKKQLQVVFIQSVIVDLHLATLPLIGAPPSVTGATFQTLSYVIKAADEAERKGGEAAFLATVENLSLIQLKNVVSSTTIPIYLYKSDKNVGSLVSELRQLDKLGDTFQDRIHVRTANCVHAIQSKK